MLYLLSFFSLTDGSRQDIIEKTNIFFTELFFVQEISNKVDFWQITDTKSNEQKDKEKRGLLVMFCSYIAGVSQNIVVN